jgi:hypothetical protein
MIESFMKIASKISFLVVPIRKQNLIMLRNKA